jgi:flavin reductase (DIM6/NTAB) family NADH-FMN oxidoreductase RutF
VNMATWELRNEVSLTGSIEERGVDEMAAVGLATAPSTLVKPPRVAASPVHFECRHYTTLVLPGRSAKLTTHIVVGRVIGIHIADEFITADGRVDILKIRPLARLGYLDYTSVESVTEIAGRERAARAVASAVRSSNDGG